ncbi:MULTISPECIES: hypothetical protein [Mesorhizobium]|uniref:hypothetical protein n=1 Tax=Mesorhizobium TaxID=68287 RepID=UPI0010C11DEA|nr:MULTISPECIES: hypothetical protein [Mesorhizobium]
MAVPALLALIAKLIDRSPNRVRAHKCALDFLTAIVAAILLVLAAQPTWAHSRRESNATVTGIAIPSLTHGQMAVISDYRKKILNLAATQSTSQDAPFSRVLNFARIQFAYCMWGLVPYSVKDEASPFNECSHAYLAATKELLIKMSQENPANEQVVELMTQIDMDMVRNNTSLVLCQYSDESFNTADVIKPDFRRVALHPPSFAAFAGFLVIIVGGFFVAARATRVSAR